MAVATRCQHAVHNVRVVVELLRFHGFRVPRVVGSPSVLRGVAGVSRRDLGQVGRELSVAAPARQVQVGHEGDVGISLSRG